MGIMREIYDIFSMQSSQSKRLRLIDLGIIFEMDTSLNNEDVVNAIHSLLSYAFNKNNMEIKDDIFNSIQEAVFYRKVADKVNWDIVIADEKNIQKEDLIWVFEFLGSSHKEKYLGFLKKYMYEKDESISKEAIDAITEIKYNVSSRSPEFEIVRKKILEEIKYKKEEL